MPPPWPPIVKPGRTMAGRPTSASARSAAAMSLTISERGTREPGLSHRLPEEIAVLGPADRLVVRADQLDAVALERAVLESARARLSAVPPPSVGSSASGRSRSITRATESGSSGSM